MIETIVDFENAVRRAVASMEKFSPGFLDFLKQKIGGVAGMDFDKFLTFKAGMGYRDFENMENIGNATPPIPVVALNIMLGDWMAFRGMSYPHIPILHAGYVSLVPPLPSWESIYRECGWPDNDGRLPIPSRLQFEVFAASDPIMPLHIVFEDGEFDKAVAALRDETTVRIDFRTGHAGQAFRLNKTTEGLNVEARYWDTQVVNRPLVGDIAEDFIYRWEEVLPHVQHWFKIVRFVRSVLMEMRMGIEVAA